MSSSSLSVKSGVFGLADMGGVRVLDLGLGSRGASATCLPFSCIFPFMAWFRNVDSHDHVIGLVGSAFNEQVLLDTDHRLISDKVRPAPPSSTIPSIPRVHSYFHHISDTPPFVPVPLVSPFIPMFPVSLISVSMPL